MQSAPQLPPQEIVEFERLVQFVSEQRCLVLTGAGCSTESGIPDYRGEGRPNPPRTPIQHSESSNGPKYDGAIGRGPPWDGPPS